MCVITGTLIVLTMISVCESRFMIICYLNLDFWSPAVIPHALGADCVNRLSLLFAAWGIFTTHSCIPLYRCSLWSFPFHWSFKDVYVTSNSFFKTNMAWLASSSWLPCCNNTDMMIFQRLTRLQDGRQGFDSRQRHWRTYSLRHRVQTGCVAHAASYRMSTRGSCVGRKEAWVQTRHSAPSSTEINNVWSYTSTPPIRLHGVVLSQVQGQLKFLPLPLSCYFLPLGSKYSPERSSQTTLNLCSFLNVKDRTPYNTVTSLYCHCSTQLCTRFCRRIKYE
jgi:hypothetical protein